MTLFKCQMYLARTALIGDTFQIELEFRNVGFWYSFLLTTSQIIIITFLLNNVLFLSEKNLVLLGQHGSLQADKSFRSKSV